MSSSMNGFGSTAISLSRNPLGIIALFIVLVYGLASQVTVFAGNLTAEERTPLIYFLVIFPVFVLVVFAWLVSRHSGKLFAPADFRDDANYIQMQQTQKLYAVASLTAASKAPPNGVSIDLDRIVTAVERAPASPRSEGWRSKILWVDDRPENQMYERRAFEAYGITFELSQNTTDALQKLAQQRFGAVISDMGRKEGPREGYALLDDMRRGGDQTPLFFYASSNAPEHTAETLLHGGQGSTNDPDELFRMVTSALIRS
jgi:CheY-like chemotaxis protein